MPIRLVLRALSPIAPWLVARFALVLFQVTQRFTVPSREHDWLARAEPVEFSLDGGRIAGWSWGQGPTVLLMHGWGGRGSQMGALADPVTQAGFRVIALDAPGHGASEGRLSSLPQFAATVEVAAKRWGPLHGVVAHSFGAAGTAVATAAGLKIERIVFISAPSDLHVYMLKFQRLVGMSDRSLRMMLDLLERQFGVSWEQARHATTDFADDTPLLILNDTEEDETPIAGAREIAKAWPNSCLVETSGLGHRRILREPSVIARAVEFLKDPSCAATSH